MVRSSYIVVVVAIVALVNAPVGAAGDEPPSGLGNVILTENAAPESFLPPAEARKARKAVDATRFGDGFAPAAAESSCSNLYVQNTHGQTWANYFTEFSQLYWCWNYRYVSYVYRNRGIEGSRGWGFVQWTGYGAGGCVGCWQVSVSSSAQWKLPRPLWYDAYCYPWERLVGDAMGFYSYDRSSC
jgi:hypothetical protein